MYERVQEEEYLEYFLTIRITWMKTLNKENMFFARYEMEGTLW
jgi:hypothetical protein